MTVKGFFKSNAFKCIVTLLCVLLVSGVLLTIAYGFMEVSDGERLQRAVKKVYTASSPIVHGVDENGKDKIIDADEKDPKGLTQSVTSGKATILSAYIIKFEGSDEVNYLVQSRGKEGYSGGTVTCWVAINVDFESRTVLNIAKVQIGENTNQSFIGKITEKMLNDFTKNLPEDGFTTKGDDATISSGATFSSNAICNAVNGAVEWVKKDILTREEVA
ncbi:MAG: hypothetical protein J1G05_01295 [Clostridiales bacterium]|nr:hypothetical protein [Clostridiales bacterium]